METYYTHTCDAITLDSQVLSKGGEGSIYKIKASGKFCKGYCAKLYHKAVEKQLAQTSREVLSALERKMIYMVEHQPKQVATGMWMLSWPVAVLYDRSKAFVGIIMPLAFERSIKLSQLIINIKLPGKSAKSYWNNWTAGDWERFDVRQPMGLLGRLKLLANICQPLHQVHSLGTYVFVDLKPDNILINARGQVSVCDIDSIQISEAGKLLFAASACTPDYCPAEKPQDSLFDISWDHFSLSVIMYKSLFLIHPFTGTCKPPYDRCETTRSMIDEGLYPHGTMAKHFDVVNKFHANLRNCPKAVGDMFLQAFDKDKGWSNPRLRPSAENWGRMLANESQKMESFIRKNPPPPPIPDPDKPTVDLALFKSIAWIPVFNNSKDYEVKTKTQAPLDLHLQFSHDAKVSCEGVATLMMEMSENFLLLQELDISIRPNQYCSVHFNLNREWSEEAGVYPLTVFIRPKVHKGKVLALGMDEYSEVFRALSTQRIKVGNLKLTIKKQSFWRRSLSWFGL